MNTNSIIEQSDKRHNLGRKFINVKEDVWELLDSIDTNRNFNSKNETVKYLLDIEKDLRKRDGIVEYKACKKCGVPIDIKLDSYNGITHQHINSKSNCFGCITTKYRVKTEQSGAKDAKDEPEHKSVDDMNPDEYQKYIDRQVTEGNMPSDTAEQLKKMKKYGDYSD